jgi:hypothetical protein
MNRLIEGFKECAHQAGGICCFPVGKLIRSFGLEDFLENGVEDDDDAPTIAVKALLFFCDDGNPLSEQFKFGVLTVGIYLNCHHANRGKAVPQQALKDLVRTLCVSQDEAQLRRWITSHFG